MTIQELLKMDFKAWQQVLPTLSPETLDALSQELQKQIIQGRQELYQSVKDRKKGMKQK